MCTFTMTISRSLLRLLKIFFSSIVTALSILLVSDRLHVYLVLLFLSHFLFFLMSLTVFHSRFCSLTFIHHSSALVHQMYKVFEYHNNSSTDPPFKQKGQKMSSEVQQSALFAIPGSTNWEINFLIFVLGVLGLFCCVGSHSTGLLLAVARQLMWLFGTLWLVLERLPENL